MKNLFLKYIVLIGVFCFLFSGSANAQNMTIDVVSKIDKQVEMIRTETSSDMEQAILTETPAKEQYDRLLDQLEPTTQTWCTKGESNEINLNDYYGGAYLDDNKILTICSTSSDSEIVAQFKEAAGSSEVVVRKVDYTLDEIDIASNEFVKQLFEYREENNLNDDGRSLIADIIETYTNVFENRVTVGILGINERKIELFWELFDLPVNIIGFEDGVETDLYASIRPGSGVYHSLSASNSGAVAHQSIGYRGYRVDNYGNKVYGFVACGHAAVPELYRSSQLVGEIYDSRCGGKYDVAFYDATANASLSNLTSYSDDVGGDTETVYLSTLMPPTNKNILIGSTAMKVGGATFYTQGIIESLNYTFVTDNYTHTGMMKTKAFAKNGDSGGAVFIYYDGKYFVVGTVTGGDITQRYSVVAQYQYAYNALDSVIYRY